MVECLFAKPLNRSEAKGDLVMIQTLLLFKCKLLYYYANWKLVSITKRSPSFSLSLYQRLGNLVRQNCKMA